MELTDLHSDNRRCGETEFGMLEYAHVVSPIYFERIIEGWKERAWVRCRGRIRYRFLWGEGIASHGFSGPLDYGERSLYCFCRNILIWTTGMAFIPWLQVEEKKQAAADVLDQYSKFVMACIGNQVRPCDLRLHLMKVVKPLNLQFLHSKLILTWGSLVFLF